MRSGVNLYLQGKINYRPTDFHYFEQFLIISFDKEKPDTLSFHTLKSKVLIREPPQLLKLD